MFLENGSEMVPDGSGMVLDHSQTLLEHFVGNMVCWEHVHKKARTIKKRRRAVKPFLRKQVTKQTRIATS